MQFQLLMRYINILLNPPSKPGSLAQQNIDDGFLNVNLPLESDGSYLILFSTNYGVRLP